MKCKLCTEKDEQIKTANNLIKSMTKTMDNAAQAVKVLNLKIEEQEATIMKVNNGLMKAMKINNLDDRLQKPY